MPERTQEWQGKSGQRYTYIVHRMETPMPDVAGNYIFAYEYEEDGIWYWEPVYIGQGNLRDRSKLSNQDENEECIEAHEATHFHWHTRNKAWHERRAEEEDLITAHEPSCNDQV